MTLFAWGRPRQFPRLPAPEARYFDSDRDTRVLAHCYWQPERASRPLLLALHGLEGSSAAHYMRGIADKAVTRGFNVVLLNQRNCGGTENTCAGLYHSGLTQDAAFVIDELARTEGISQVVVAGYSLGGNLALKLAGDFGSTPPPQLRGVAAVSPIIEIGQCVDALERRSNIAYQFNFVRGLRARMRRKALVHPGRFDLSTLGRIWTVRQFDATYTAPFFGFASAEDYYHRASAMRVIDKVARPALILSAADDPFVPPEIFDTPAVRDNPHITTMVTSCGGHCAFVETANGDDGYFAERAVVDFLANRV